MRLDVNHEKTCCRESSANLSLQIALYLSLPIAYQSVLDRGITAGFLFRVDERREKRDDLSISKTTPRLDRINLSIE